MNLQTAQKLTIDFNQNSYKAINAKQYDKESRSIIIQCTDNGTFVPLDDTIYANARTLTADGRALLDSTTILEDGTILFELDDTLLAAPGRATVQIDTYQKNTNKRLTSMKFFVNVEASVYEDGTIEAGDEFHALTDLMAKALDTYDSVITKTQEITEEAKGFAADAETGAQHAANSAADAAGSAVEAANSATQAENSASEALAQAKAAEAKAEESHMFMENAANHADLSKQHADTSNDHAQVSKGHADMSKRHADTSDDYAQLSKSYAMGDTGKRENEALDNAKYYYEQAKNISESFAGTLRPKGTILFADLPSAPEAEEGDMYNISDQFATTSAFKEGEGNVIAAGSNVYRTDDGFWDVLAGSPVTGVKGESESTYRRGNVSITPENIGLGNVDNTADADKPVSTLQQEALDGKLNKAGDTMTGLLNVEGSVTATSFVGNASSSSKWATARSINGMSVDGTKNISNYAVCSTAADSATKTVHCDGFSLLTGAEITVKFATTNTAANPTLDVNGTGAKPIYYHGTAINSGYLVANHTYIFRYNGTQYEVAGDINTNTTYKVATTSADGLMSKDDKVKLDSLPGIDDMIGRMKEIMLESAYPVGAIYMNTSGANPTSFLGGTWISWGAGRVPVGIGSNGTTNYTQAESIGGAESRSHNHSAATSGGASLTTGGPSNNTSGSTAITTAQMPSHNHSISLTSGASGGHSHTVTVSNGLAGSSGNWVNIYGTGHSGSASITSSGVGDHSHSVSGSTGSSGSGSGHTHTLSSHTHSISSHTHSIPDTDSKSIDVRQPYITCYMWKRTA